MRRDLTHDDSVTVRLARSCYDTWWRTVLMQSSRVSDAIAELRTVFGREADMIQIHAADVAETTTMSYENAFWKLYLALKHRLSLRGPSDCNVAQVLADTVQALKADAAISECMGVRIR